MKDNSGVYKFTSPSGKVYIGQSSNFNRRKTEHKYASKNKINKLYSSFNKYGMDNHKFEILFLSNDAYEKNRMEQFYINFYNTIESGLNLVDVSKGIRSFTGKKHTEEEVKRIKERMKGFKPIKAIEKISKKVYCEITNKTYNSLTSCAKDLGLSQSYVTGIVGGKYNNKYGLKLA